MKPEAHASERKALPSDTAGEFVLIVRQAASLPKSWQKTDWFAAEAPDNLADCRTFSNSPAVSRVSALHTATAPRSGFALGQRRAGELQVRRAEPGVDFHRALGVRQSIGGFSLLHQRF